MTGLNLLAGPDPRAGAESAAQHLARLGPLPSPCGLIDTLERSGLRGRGGAAFPVATKWRSVHSRRDRHPVVLVNGAEGEPLSRKDRTLMESRPHLVLDGAELAARTLGADEVIVLVGAEHAGAVTAVRRALAERGEELRGRTRVVTAPVRYVTGEESAAVRYVNEGIALPTSTPPRPFERGIGGRPTLVQNVESLAQVALIARFGDEWFRSLGRGAAVGTVLLTVSGAVASPGVLEVPQGAAIGEAVGWAGGATHRAEAVLLGSYFGGWVAIADAWNLPVDSAALPAHGLALGCGVVGVLPEHRCGVVETARIVSYLADQSARQCGPCVFGLRAIAEAVSRIAASASVADDLVRITRWSQELRGRGACHHPDGAAGFVLSALRVFAEEFSLHHQWRRCSTTTIGALVA